MPRFHQPCFAVLLWLLALTAQAATDNTTKAPASRMAIMAPPLPKQQPQPPKDPVSNGSVWTHTVPDLATWQRLSLPRNGEEFSKFVVDVKSGEFYFIDAHVFTLHVDFVLDYLQKKPRTRDNLIAYNHNYQRIKPEFVLGYLTHYPQTDTWVFSFWEGDDISAAQIATVKQQLRSRFFIADVLFRPDSPKQEIEAQSLRRLGVNTISNDKLYKSKTFQALNQGQAIGTLVVVPVGTAPEDLQFKRSDIVLLQESYPDIPPVAGIITSHFSAPLSHVNLRATAWGIPNAGDKKAYEHYADLAGKTVFLAVNEQDMTLRLVTAAEQAQQQNQPLKKAHLPKAQLKEKRLLSLDQIEASNPSGYGTKTANLAKIVTAQLEGMNVPTGFGVPFYEYQHHLKINGLQQQINTLINDPAWRDDAQDPLWQKRGQQLAALRQSIQNAPLDPSTLQSISVRIKEQMGDAGVFVRSSTNAEDLAGFNGAGLYDTVPNVKGDAALEAAIKKVWASLWNLRAVQERHAFGIDDHQVFAAVLIQKGVNATAAGVLVTQDIFTRQPDTYTINAKWGLGMRVVEGQKIPEQILYDRSNHGTRILSRSDEKTMLTFDPEGGIKEIALPPQKGILSEARARRLGDMVGLLLNRFPDKNSAEAQCQQKNSKPATKRLCGEIPPQVLDIEWVLEDETFWIVQARPYVQASH